MSKFHRHPLFRLSFVLPVLAIIGFGLQGLAASAAASLTPTVTVTNCTESGLNTALAGGGTITFQCGGPATITFSGEKTINSAIIIDGSNGGHALTLSGGGSTRHFNVTGAGDLTLRNLTLSNGHSGPSGPLWEGASIYNLGQVTLENVIASGNHSEWNGGVFYTRGQVTLNNVIASGNHADASGGVIYQEGDSGSPGYVPSQVTVNGGRFEDNTATDNGAVIYSKGQVTLENVVATGNQAGQNGVIFMERDSGSPNQLLTHLTLNGGRFEDNTAGSSGSAVASRGSVSIDGVTFRANEGTVVHIQPSNPFTQTVTIEASLFEGNTPSWTGTSPVVIDTNAGDSVLVEGNTFRNNTSTWSGGAASITQNCFGTPTYSQVISHNTFSGNQTEFGGGGLVAYCALVVQNTFEGNEAASNGAGLEGRIVVVDGNTFRNNRLFATDHNAKGSALFVEDNGSAVRNNTITGNQILGEHGYGGGALSVSASGIVIENNTIANNSSEAGASALLINDHHVGLTVRHNTITGNSGGERTIGHNSSFDPSVFEGNILDLYCPWAGDLISGGHNLLPVDNECMPLAVSDIIASPGLAALGNYGGPNMSRMPYTGSAVIDAAGNNCPATDQRGMPRPHGAACDIGAVEADNPVAVPPPQAPGYTLQSLSYPTTSLPDSQQGAKALGSGGDPVDLIFGNFTYEQTDLTLPGVGLPVRIHRTYNSALPADGMLGWGWNLTYKLSVSQTATNTVSVTRGDGRIDAYTLEGDGSLTPPPNSAEMLVKHLDGSYTLTSRDFIVYEFASGGNLISAADPDGNTVTFGYSGSQWTTITDASGRSWNLAYNPQGRLESVTDPAGRSVQYGYDAQGNLVTVINPEGGVASYSYDSSHRLTRIEDANGHLYLENSYGEDGRVGFQTDARGLHTFVYAANSTTYTDPTGASSVIGYDSNYRITSRTNPLGGTTLLTYHVDGLIDSETDANGGMTQYSYDARGNVVTKIDPLGQVWSYSYDARDNLLSTTDPLGRTSSTTYSASDHPLTVTDALTNTTAYTYDSRGLLTTQTDALGHTTTFGHDIHGNLISRTNPLSHTWTYEYDSAGRVITATDALGRITGYMYNNLDLVVATTLADSGVISTTYDAVGNVISSSDPLGHVTSFVYSPANDLVSQTDALGQVTAFAYDDMGRQVERTLPDGTSWHTMYDSLGRVVSETTPLSHTVSYAYDAVGNLLAATDALGRTTQYAYDALNRLVVVTDTLGGVAGYGYDAVGNRTTITDTLGQASHYSYDALNRPVSEMDPLGNSSQQVYDAVGRVISSTNGAGQTILYSYDVAGNLLSTTAGATVLSYSYDAVGNRVVMTDTQGVTSFAWDTMDRLSQVSGPQGILNYSYDAAGNRTSLTGAGDPVTYTYDDLNRLATVSSGGNPIAGYEYDAAGNMVEEQFGNGVLTDYSYDDAGRLLGLHTTGPGGELMQTTYTLDAAGNRLAEQSADFTAGYNYDALDRLIGATVTFTPTLAAAPDASIGRSGDDIILQWSGSASQYEMWRSNKPYLDPDNPGPVTPELLNTNVYTDVGAVQSSIPIFYAVRAAGGTSALSNRLGVFNFGLVGGTGLPAAAPDSRAIPLPTISSAAAAATHTYAYSYDASGNRLTVTEDGVTTTFVYDAASRLESINGAPVLHDAAGRLVDDGASNYLYDAFDRLLTVSSTVSVTYQYDGLQNRVSASTNGATEIYLLDLATPLPVRVAVSSGSDTRYHLYGLRQAATVLPGGAALYSHADGLGSVRLLTDAGGAVAGGAHYSPFGAPLQVGGPFGFTGEPRDSATGLVHLRARDYSPALGRFLTPDPVSSHPLRSQGLNPYHYVENNPVNRVDPSGLCWWVCDAAQAAWNTTVSAAKAVGDFTVKTTSQIGSGIQSALNGFRPPLTESSGNKQLGSPGAGIISDKGSGVIAAGGGNVIAAGGGNVIAAGGGNVIAAGGGNVIGAGGGNVIGAGGGNVIGAGGGNVIGAGGGNLIGVAGGN